MSGNEKKITAIWFSYAGDQDILPYSLKSFRDVVPEARLIVVDDCYVPCSAEIRGKCETLGVEWRLGSFPRNGNLLGPEPLLGMAEIYYEASLASDIVCKVDCDTFVFSRNWIDRLAEDREAVIAAAVKRQHHYLFGMAYAMKSAVIKDLYEDIRDIPSWPGTLEDFEIGSRLFRISGKKVEYAHRYCVFPHSAPFTRWGLVPPESILSADDPRKYFDVVSIGWQDQGRRRDEFIPSRLEAAKKLYPAGIMAGNKA